MVGALFDNESIIFMVLTSSIAVFIQGKPKQNPKHMKKIISALFFFTVVSAIYSCKDKEKPEPVGVIDSTLLKPEIKFRYVILDSGEVQFYNETKYAVSYKWYTDWMYSKSKNPKLRFLFNDNHQIVLRAYSKYGVRKDSIFKIDITNVVSSIELATIKGTIFGEHYEYSSGAIPRNNFLGYGEPSFPKGTPISAFGLSGLHQQIYLADFMKVQGRDSVSMKNNFKVGYQPLAILTSYPTGDYSLKQPGWYLLFTGKNGSYGTGNNNPTESLEILEVKEVYQPRLYPEMQNKAFWVTWHFKADTGVRGKIDCILKMKYIIYEQYFD